MVGIDRNGRDGGVEKRRYSSTYSPSFHFFYFSLFLSFFPSFFLASFFSFSLLFCFCNIRQNFKRVYKNKDMEELFHGGLKRVCQSVKCNV